MNQPTYFVELARMRKTTIAAAANPARLALALGLAAAAALLAVAAPAQAEGDRDTDTTSTTKIPSRVDCVPLVHGTDGITVTAGGKYSFDPAGGLILETTVVEDAVHWKGNLTAPVKMDDVKVMRYSTRKLDDGTGNAAALPAYRVFITDANGGPGNPGNTTTLVYEPYYNITGNPALNTTQTWDVLAGKFWATKSIGGITAEPGGSYAGNRTWSQIKAANPNAQVVAIGIGQGTYNKGTKAWTNHAFFGTYKACTDHVWVKPKPSPSPSLTVTATPTVPPANGGGSLPITGISAPTMIATGGLLTLLGVGLVWMVRRRKRLEFTAS